MSVVKHMGERLRSIRLRSGLSLRSVAAAIGVSPSLLSQVETGKTQPSVSTLYALVTHLGVTLDEVLPEHDAATPPLGAGRGPAVESTRPPVSAVPAHGSLSAVHEVHGGVLGRGHEPEDGPIQRAQDNPRIEMGNGVVWERMAIGRLAGVVDPLMVTYAPQGSSATDGRLMRHSGIEYGVVLEGRLTLQLDFDTYELGPGDSMCFESLRPHLFTNRTDDVVRGVWFVLGRRESSGLEEHVLRSATAGPRRARSVIDVLEAMDGHHDGTAVEQM